MAKRRPRTVPQPVLPPSHNDRIREMGLNTISYQRSSVVVEDGRSEWLPRDIVGNDGRTVIIFRSGGDYAFDGWEPWHDGMFGGRYDGIHAALGWAQTAMDVRAGRAQDFRGR